MATAIEVSELRMLTVFANARFAVVPLLFVYPAVALVHAEVSVFVPANKAVAERVLGASSRIIISAFLRGSVAVLNCGMSIPYLVTPFVVKHAV